MQICALLKLIQKRHRSVFIHKVDALRWILERTERLIGRVGLLVQTNGVVFVLY